MIPFRCLSATVSVLIMTFLLFSPAAAEPQGEGMNPATAAADAVAAKKEKKQKKKEKETDKKQPDEKEKEAETKKEASEEKSDEKDKSDESKEAAKSEAESKNKDEKDADSEKKDEPKKDSEKKADDKADKTAKPGGETKPPAAACKQPTYELKNEPFVIKVSLKGVFAAQKMSEVLIRPEVWSNFNVLKAVEHGAQVKQGDLLVSLDTEKIDLAIADMRADLRLAGLSLKKAEKELQTIETLSPLELAALERSKRIADEDYDYFYKHELPFAKETVKFKLKSGQNYVDYQKEELRQLEKMYKADEVTEETEEIILRRARDSVAEGEFYLKGVKQSCKRALESIMPRQEEYIKDEYKRQDEKLQAGKALFPLELEKKRLEFEKMKVEYERADKKLKDILHDRELMTIKSPADGIVYYGRCVDGRWSGGRPEGRFERDSSLPVKQVFMTIVQTRPMSIAAEVAEKDLHDVRGGMKGTAKPTAYSDLKLDVIVDKVAAIPNGSNFAAKFTAALDKKAEPLMPGMTCDVSLVAYEKKDALAVPLSSLKADPLDEDKFFVHVVGKDGKDQKHEVEVGRRDAKKAEILKGLKAGDKILLVCPKDEKKDGE